MTKGRGLILVLVGISCIIAINSGCSGKKEKKVEKKQLKTVSRFTDPKIRHISDNPRFFSARQFFPKDNAMKNLDKAIRPVLQKVFSDAKLIREGGANPKQEIKNTITYSVRMLFTVKDADELHAALIAARFKKSPRLGGKPTHTRTKALMSLFKTTRFESTRGKSYSLVVEMDAKNQTILIKSYELDSKYDRLL